MALFSFQNGSFKKIGEVNFQLEGILERRHLQSALREQISIVVPDCLIIAEEFSQWAESQRRIDLLGVDKDANLVVIEIKRTETGEHMELQALRYAAMVSTLTFGRACEIYQAYLNKLGREADAKSALLEFLNWIEPQEDDFALDVKVVLVSANFSKELTTCVMWLNERNLDIRCVRLIPYRYKDGVIVDVQQIIPLPESQEYQVKMKQQSQERRSAQTQQKDYTRYAFKGQTYNKRKLVLAVIKHWIAEKNPQNIAELASAFPQEIQGRGLFIPVAEAKRIYERQGIDRHFLGDDEIIIFPDSTQFAISNQWGKGNIGKFITQAQKMGYEIEEII